MLPSSKLLLKVSVILYSVTYEKKVTLLKVTDTYIGVPKNIALLKEKCITSRKSAYLKSA